jgi:hypothetical protein
LNVTKAIIGFQQYKSAEGLSPVQSLDMPVEPFKREEIKLLIKACDFCEGVETDHRCMFIIQQSTFKLDRAIMLKL